MAAQWICPACTFANPGNVAMCGICLTGQGRGSFSSAPVAAASSATKQRAGDSMVMTPPLLSQKWRSYGRSKISTPKTFSQRSHHIFSNFATHPPLDFVVPSYCHSYDLERSGRGDRFAFGFAEKAIMACKAALFRDYRTFDKILCSGDAMAAKRLGRRVSSFDQDVWDAHQCLIARDVAIAKLGWPDFREELLRTGSDIITECTAGDWVWGSALDASDGDVFYPGRWGGINILGWSLMEARDEAKTRQQHKAQVPAPISSTLFGANSENDIEKGCAHVSDSSKRQKQGLSEEKLNPNSIKHLATQYTFGPNAFGPLQPSDRAQRDTADCPDLSCSVKKIVESSVPESRHIRGQRGNKPVTSMLTDIYRHGLFMHGSKDSSVNQTVIPAFRHIVLELSKMEYSDGKRVSMVRALVEACQDCQQVQARTILRMYADLTCRTETLERQLKYSLVPFKEAALHTLITKHHSPSCDYDHTMVSPEGQRAHLWSGYVALIGDAFGLDGVVAANGDRFLNACLSAIRNVHRCGGTMGFGRSSPNDQLKRYLIDELTKDLCAKEWLVGLIGDINNQSADATRRIERSCIFKWASANTKDDFRHRVFYDEAREEEYSDLDPKEPTEDNKYEPFLSPVVLVEMLVRANMLQRKT